MTWTSLRIASRYILNRIIDRMSGVYCNHGTLVLIRDGTSYFLVFSNLSTNEAAPYQWSLPDSVVSNMLSGIKDPTFLPLFRLSHSKKVWKTSSQYGHAGLPIFCFEVVVYITIHSAMLRIRVAGHLAPVSFPQRPYFCKLFSPPRLASTAVSEIIRYELAIRRAPLV